MGMPVSRPSAVRRVTAAGTLAPPAGRTEAEVTGLLPLLRRGAVGEESVVAHRHTQPGGDVQPASTAGPDQVNVNGAEHDPGLDDAPAEDVRSVHAGHRARRGAPVSRE